MDLRKVFREMYNKQMENAANITVSVLDISQEQSEQIEYLLAQSGSPYNEVVRIEEQRVYVNPYLHYGGIMAKLLSNADFLNSNEGKLLFHKGMEILREIEIYKGFDKNYFLKKSVENEIKQGYFGDKIIEFYEMLTAAEQNRLLENIVKFYQSEQCIDIFARQVIALFPNSLLFQKKENTKCIYIYMGEFKTSKALLKIERCKELFLSPTIQVYIAWEEPFLITDLQRFEATGKHIV